MSRLLPRCCNVDDSLSWTPNCRFSERVRASSPCISSSCLNSAITMPSRLFPVTRYNIIILHVLEKYLISSCKEQHYYHKHQICTYINKREMSQPDECVLFDFVMPKSFCAIPAKILITLMKLHRRH